MVLIKYTWDVFGSPRDMCATVAYLIKNAAALVPGTQERHTRLRCYPANDKKNAYFFVFTLREDTLTNRHPKPPFLLQRRNHRHLDYDILENRAWVEENVCVQGVNVWIPVNMMKMLIVELNRRH